MKHREQISEEMYEEALKDAQRIHDKAMANPPEKSLIERQIEIAANFLERIEKELSMTGRLDAVCVLGVCERLLQIVQNQQRQIEELQKSPRSLSVDMCMCNHSIDDHGLPRGRTLCGCKSFCRRSNV